MSKHHSSQDLPITVGQYKLYPTSILGKGVTGTVYKGSHLSGSIDVAIKAIDLTTIQDDATRGLLENQKKALQIIKNSYVVKHFDTVQNHNFCYLITQICQGGSLSDQIAKVGRITEEVALQMFKKIVVGCISITQNCIIHRDLKPSNIILRKNRDPVIIDFGFCEIIRSKQIMRTFNVGSPSYMAPQAYLKTMYSEKSESWSLGMILYEMLTGKTMDEGMPIKDFFEKIKLNNNFVSSFLEMIQNKTLKEIIEKSLKYMPSDRMSISSMKFAIDMYLMNLKNQKNNQTTQPLKTNVPKPDFFNFAKDKNPTKYNQVQINLSQKSLYTEILTQKSILENRDMNIISNNNLKESFVWQNGNKVNSKASIYDENKMSQIKFVQRAPLSQMSSLRSSVQNNQNQNSINHNRNFLQNSQNPNIKSRIIYDKPLIQHIQNMKQSTIQYASIPSTKLSSIPSTKLSSIPSTKLSSMPNHQPSFRTVTVRYL